MLTRLPSSTSLRAVPSKWSFVATRAFPRSFATVKDVTPPGAHTILKNHPARVGRLTTFTLPQAVNGGASDIELGKQMVDTWRKDGIFQVRVIAAQARVFQSAYAESKDFFKRSAQEKAKYVDDQSFSGYIASGEEITDGVADYSEIFTVTKDLPSTDPRVQRKWPCHGPCPWPSVPYKDIMTSLMGHFGDAGETILKLTALGLGLPDPDTLTHLTEDGWHHMRILRFPHLDQTNGRGKPGRGIGSHTDYGLLVLAWQDDVGGLFVRPPYQGETTRNWEVSAAGLHENDDKWVYVPPVEGVLTVFPGDMMQFITNNYLPSTPHKVGLNVRERFAFAYFHEPSFSSVLRQLPQYGQSTDEIHYGTHFTNMFMRNYPERITAKRMLAENRMDLLQSLKSAEHAPHGLRSE